MLKKVCQGTILLRVNDRQMFHLFNPSLLRPAALKVKRSWSAGLLSPAVGYDPHNAIKRKEYFNVLKPCKQDERHRPTDRQTDRRGRERESRVSDGGWRLPAGLRLRCACVGLLPVLCLPVPPAAPAAPVAPVWLLRRYAPATVARLGPKASGHLGRLKGLTHRGAAGKAAATLGLAMALRAQGEAPGPLGLVAG